MVNGVSDFLGVSNYVLRHVDDPFGNFSYSIGLKTKGMPEPNGEEDSMGC
ncbi:MAG: hypothetical protein KAK00_08615 [Nanoarchaeota archaeon]|nr:hypothetical protein [Nanoarchaeota archaeon]